jgi:hypothetical protein
LNFFRGGSEQEKNNIIFFFVSDFLDRSTGKPLPLNLLAANRPLFDLLVKGAKCHGGAALPRSHLSG